MQPIPTGYPIQTVSGPLIVAYLLHWGLFGALSVQLYLYYLAFPKDRKFTKCLVYGIYLVEFVQTMIFTHDAFATFGYGFSDLKALTGMYSNWLTIPILSSVSACVGQAFYAYRIFILSKSRIVPVFIICVSITSFAAGIITGVYCFPADDVTELVSPRTSIAVGILCRGSALCDIVIAICMTYYLTRRSTSLRQTRILVTKLIRLTIETGTVTAVGTLLIFILFFAFPHQTFYEAPAIITVELYANTVLMVLNSRIRIMGGRDIYTSDTDIVITTDMIRDMTFRSTEGTRPMAHGMQARVPVVTMTQEIFNDDHEVSRSKERPQESIIGPSV
ncbi:hypothetical protein EDD18DRAFT_1260641 [Armillaria luteobubalina]|uniref:DUF6534 domain-containing protein n=1 Tax=Armillaria luteobubalina TaxID=153913 RepID=A0AA39UFW9_9AGAR|nr:hypothetical protein EDD18DRAFT_1260641 [Armillaria luteobubalina]